MYTNELTSKARELKELKTMSDALTVYMNGAYDKKATIICITDFGGYAILPVRLHYVSFAPYEQYSEAIHIVCTLKGERKSLQLILHSRKTFAIFADWVTPTASIGETRRTASGILCEMWNAFDRNEFYKIVDSTDGKKIAEQSERLHLDELKQHNKIYKVYGIGVCEIFNTESELLSKYEKVGEMSGGHLRYELQGTPQLKGLCGAMWDDYDDNGNACIRYETDELNNILSA